MKLLRCSGFVALALAAGCHLPKIETEKIDYQAAKQNPPLEVPPDLARPATDDRFVIPPAGTGAAKVPGAVEAPAAGAAAAPAAPRASLIKNEGGGAGIIVLSDSFDRGWRRVGLALDRAGFTVESRERDKGGYQVRYTDTNAPEKKEGLLSWFGLGKGKPPEEKHYLISVKTAGDATQVEVLDQAGKSDASDTAVRILGLLYEQLR